jgi:Holliday junction resolvase
LIGPFTATTDGGWMLEPEAWSSVLPLSFSAQIKVKWTELKILENAGKKFAFLDTKVCRLDAVQTANILSVLECAPTFSLAMKEGALIPEAESRFMKFLNAKGIGFIRFSQYLDDFSRILKSFKAKRPDFIAFSGTTFLIEVKPHPCSDEVTLEVDEVEKLKQLELLTHLKTIIAFPADVQGIEWKHISPFVLWAHGDRKTAYHKQVLSMKASMLDQLAL